VRARGWSYTLLERAQARLRRAQEILADLDLLERWRAFGHPVVVGAVAYGLVVAPDIDVEVYCRSLRIEDGFEVLKACAGRPHVTEVRFANHLAGPDQGYYWRVGYRHPDGQDWKIDTWSVAHDHPGPRGANLVEPMRRALTTETRRRILAIKEEALGVPSFQCPSIHVYRAVLEDGVRTFAELQTWLERTCPMGLTAWRPGKRQ